MDSALGRLILVVLGWPALVLGLLSLFIWYQDDSDNTDIPPPNLDRVQHPVYHPTALRAIDRFRALSPSKQSEIRENLQQQVRPLAEWFPPLRRSETRVICLGENHDEYTRAFLAESIIPNLDMELLFLETTAARLKDIMALVDSGEPHVRLLNANIAPLIRAAQAANPALAIHGIEETQQTRAARQANGGGSREHSIATNLWQHFEPGRRHLLLYGALHCADHADWLYEKLRARLPNGQLLGVRVLGEHQDGPMEAFIYFLDEIGLAPGDFVMTQAGATHPSVKAWFGFLNQATLTKFQTVIVDRPAVD